MAILNKKTILITGATSGIGHKCEDTSLAEMDALWDEAKIKERVG